MATLASHLAEEPRATSSPPLRSSARKSASCRAHSLGCFRLDHDHPSAKPAQARRRGAGDRSPRVLRGFGVRRGVRRGSWSHQWLFETAKASERARSPIILRDWPSARKVSGSLVCVSASANSSSSARILWSSMRWTGKISRRVASGPTSRHPVFRVALAEFDFLTDENDRLAHRVERRGHLGQLGVGAGLKVLGQEHLVRPHQVGRCPVRENEHTGIIRTVNSYLRTSS